MLVILAVVAGFVYIFFEEDIGSNRRDIEINYLCEIPISSDMKEIDMIKYSVPRLRCVSVPEYKKRLQEVFDKSELSENEIKNIKSMIERLPDDKYIYISIQYKLDGVYYREKPGGPCHNGIYSKEKYDTLFIYWSDEPLGNRVDGHI